VINLKQKKYKIKTKLKFKAIVKDIKNKVQNKAKDVIQKHLLHLFVYQTMISINSKLMKQDRSQQ